MIVSRYSLVADGICKKRRQIRIDKRSMQDAKRKIVRNSNQLKDMRITLAAHMKRCQRYMERLNELLGE